jgi:putative Mg2+ transporter-C (MgtC) family protein
MDNQIEIILRLVAASLFAAVIGLQRELKKKPAGVRTHMLISLGAALFTVISVFGFPGADPSRVAAAVVTGMGFLGAGVIFRNMRGDVVAGLTTAASVWVTSAVGTAAGLGMYLVAAVVTVLASLILWIPKVKG